MTRHTPDWERIEAEYRANVLSIREIARKHSISDRAIRNHAAAGKWERDLRKQIDVAVRTELVRADIRRKTGSESPTEAEVVQESVATQTTIVQTHRIDIGKARVLLEEAIQDLTGFVRDREQLEATIHEITVDDRDVQRRNRLLRAVSLPVQMVAIKDATHALRNLVGLERQAFGLGDSDTPTPPASDEVVHPTPEALAAFHAKWGQGRMTTGTRMGEEALEQFRLAQQRHNERTSSPDSQ